MIVKFKKEEMEHGTGNTCNCTVFWSKNLKESDLYADSRIIIHFI